MNDASETAKQFGIQKIYLKDMSFESPNAPHSFAFQKWEPKVDLNLTNSNQELEDGVFEVVLCVTATLSMEEQTTLLVEVHCAGLFQIAGFSEEERKYLIGSQCMSILFPYAREAVSDMTSRGGFPPLLLNPVNFDALYQQHLLKQGDDAGSAEESTAH